MSINELDFKKEEANLYVEIQETKESYIENKAIVEFLIQHEPRKDIDLSKIEIPFYLYLDNEDAGENKSVAKCI